MIYANVERVKNKYCVKCIHNGECYRPCPLVYAALFNLPCEEDIKRMCENSSKGGFKSE